MVRAIVQAPKTEVYRLVLYGFWIVEEKKNQIALDDLAGLMQESICNWFEFYEKVKVLTENDT